MQLASQNAPSPDIVIPHFVLGGLTWLCATLLITFSPEAFTQHYFNPKLLSITHLLVLGWITMVIFGALYQLIPVIMEVKLFSQKLAISSLAFLATGTILLSTAFWQFKLGLLTHIAATFIIIAVILFGINVFSTAHQSHKESIERDFILTSIIWLFFTVAAGFTLALNLTDPFLSPPHIELLKLHAHAGIAGWFLQLILGVSSRLLPMFMVSHHLTMQKLKLAYYLINAGLITGIISLYLQERTITIVSVLILISGIISFLSFLTEAYKKRIKKILDIGMKQSLMSFLILLVPLILVIVLFFDFLLPDEITVPLSIAYGSALLLGFITSLIMGQTYKTLPFIVWLKVYRQKVGKGKIPLPKDLYSEKALNVQLWLFASGFIVLFGGILTGKDIAISIAGAILFCSVLLYNFNIFKIIFHKPITEKL